MEDPGIHRLWAIIRDSNMRTAANFLSPVPFEVNHRHPNYRELYEERQREIFIQSRFIQLLLDCDKFGELSKPDPKKNREIFDFIACNEFGGIFGRMNYEFIHDNEHRRIYMASSRLPDFYGVISSWCKIHPNPYNIAWKDLLAQQWRAEGSNKERDDFVFRRALLQSGDSSVFSDHLFTVMKKRAENEKKRIARNKQPKTSKFKDRLLRDWIGAALWCRSTAGILVFWGEDKVEGFDIDKEIKSLDRAIREEGLKPLHHSENEDFIDSISKSKLVYF